MARALIVHPTDLQADSEAAFYHALKLGLVQRSRLSLVHVDPEGAERAPTLDSFPHVRETLTRWGLLPAGAPQSQVSDQLGLLVSKAEMLAKDAETALAASLRRRHATMIVLGTRGLAGLQRLFQGSFSEKLARAAKIPALFIPNATEGFVSSRDGSARLRNVLIPVAADPNPSGAIAEAAELAGLFGGDCQFHLLHVGRPESMSSVPLADRWRQNEIVREGPVIETIGKVAEEIDADLIVMATAGHKSFLDALRGSTTEGVLRTARRPLLAVPAR
jgi:nucleotide-binding universal stress UspA family protein